MEKVRVYIFDIANAPFKASALPVIEEKRRQDIISGTNYLYRLRSLYAGLLVRHALKAEGVALPCPTEMEYNEFGKPRVKNCNKHISITHSGNIIAVGVCDREIGIDAEIMQNKVYTHLAERVLSDREYSEYLTYTEGDSIKYFLSHWVVKESYLKCVGTGIRSFPCDVEPTADGRVNGLYYQSSDVRYKSYDYFMAVTCDKPIEVEKIFVARVSASEEN